VTATVESVPLITASILSKKLAAGLDGLVMDVKFGSGAFAADLTMARELAASIASVAAAPGSRPWRCSTDMNQVLGRHAGNSLELHETSTTCPVASRAADAPGGADARSRDVRLGRLAASDEAADAALLRALDSGAAAERFQRMVSALGGPGDLLERPERHLVEAPVHHAVTAGRHGFVGAIDTARSASPSWGWAWPARAGGPHRLPVGLAEVLGPGEALTPRPAARHRPRRER